MTRFPADLSIDLTPLTERLSAIQHQLTELEDIQLGILSRRLTVLEDKPAPPPVIPEPPVDLTPLTNQLTTLETKTASLTKNIDALKYDLGLIKRQLSRPAPVQDLKPLTEAIANLDERLNLAIVNLTNRIVSLEGRAAQSHLLLNDPPVTPIE